MKFSILLPTRDRLELLKLAVESVMRQNYQNFEIIISDNNSKDDIAAYVSSLDDHRIIYTGFDHSVSVTDNWNNAITKASGDYIIMLGDDDALSPDYFAVMTQLINDWNNPDCIYTGSYMFTYKGVIPGSHYGLVHENRNAIFWRNDYTPYLLEYEQRLKLVNDSMQFFNSFGFNMQYVTVSRRTVDALRDKNGFYQTQYPDYFAMHNILLRTNRFLVCEKPLVAIGTSHSSFGWYYQNLSENTGNQLLNIEEGMAEAELAIKQDLLPGTSMNTNWLTSMIRVYARNTDITALKPPNISRYRRKQIIYFVLLMSVNGCTDDQIRFMQSRLDISEKAFYWTLLPLSNIGKIGYRILQFLHNASQKRLLYLTKAFYSRLRRRSPVVHFQEETTILDIDHLIEKVS